VNTVYDVFVMTLSKCAYELFIFERSLMKTSTIL